ncbi:AraC family transcriptional regulator [Sediminitomix flava]|uniref:AraC-like DNA-binding protein n=1 Tax=Sediminitomix flava TaxID=379075 RepID=A0A315ZCN3_SEDFL|nr:AraC family transcriptional regulator [Sediminitomix flava]PWJ42578.1 AraC-like DNA-binding protein [Sediminitomix flava]
MSEKKEVLELPIGLFSEHRDIYEKTFQTKIDKHRNFLKFEFGSGKGIIYELNLSEGIDVVIYSFNKKEELPFKLNHGSTNDKVKFNVFLPKENNEGYFHHGIEFSSGISLWIGHNDFTSGIAPKGKSSWLTFFVSNTIMESYDFPLSLKKWINHNKKEEYLMLVESLPLEIELLTKKIQAQLQEDDKWLELEMKGLALQVLSLTIKSFYARIIKNSDVKYQLINTNDYKALLKAKQLIDQSENHFPLVYNLAKAVNLSLRKLQRQFKQVFGMTVTDYIQKKRMENAIEMLSNGKSSITDIAMKLGFASVGHFSSTFKKYFQLTPRAYQQKLRLDK